MFLYLQFHNSPPSNYPILVPKLISSILMSGLLQYTVSSFKLSLNQVLVKVLRTSSEMFHLAKTYIMFWSQQQFQYSFRPLGSFACWIRDRIYFDQSWQFMMVSLSLGYFSLRVDRIWEQASSDTFSTLSILNELIYSSISLLNSVRTSSVETSPSVLSLSISRLISTFNLSSRLFLIVSRMPLV